MTHRAAAMMIKRHFQDLSQDGTSDIPRKLFKCEKWLPPSMFAFTAVQYLQYLNERPANAVPD